MKAILVNSLSHGGAEKVALEIFNHINLTEPAKMIILENDLEYLNEDFSSDDLLILKKCKYGVIINLLYYAYQIKNIVTDNNIYYLQSHLYRSNFVNVICKKLFRMKYTCQIVNHGDPLRYKWNSFKGVVNRILIKCLYPSSDSIVAISFLMKANLKKLLSKNCKVLVVNNPYDINKIIKYSNILNDKITLPQNYYVTMGRLISLKRFDILLESVSILGYNLVIIGGGPEFENLKKIITRLDINDNVILTGKLSNPYPILKHAKAFLGASESEGFPNAIIESLALSLPIIHSDCVSGPREILSPISNSYDIIKAGYEPAEYGVLYTVGCLESLNNSIKYLENNIDYRTSLINAGRKRSMDFDSSNVVKKYFIHDL